MILKYSFAVLLLILLGANMLTARPFTEKDKINLLIESVRNLKNCSFNRNGKNYPADKAAAHLRLKLNNSRNKINTANLFIKYLASKSSITRIPYRIICRNGKNMTSREFLTNELLKLK